MILRLATLALASVFLLSAVAKLADRAGSRQAIVALGAPARFAGPLAWLVICAELAVSLALLSGTFSRGGAVGALVLLGIFSAVLAASLVRGAAGECHCFGRLATGPVGWPALARNLALASVAGYVVGGEGLGLFALVATVAGALWLGPRALNSPVRRGARAPSFSLADSTGTAWTLDRLLARRRPVLLVFSQPGCGACELLAPDLGRWQAELRDRVTLAVVSGGPGSGAGRYPVLIDDSGSVAGAYGVSATPSAVLVGRLGRIAAGTARGAGEIGALVADRFGAQAEPRFSRRTAVVRAARGLAAFGALPAIAAACGSGGGRSGTGATSVTSTTGQPTGRPKALHVGKVYLCDQTYALCTNAPCVKSKHDPNVVICDCVVKSGYSIGFETCPRRAPHGTTLYSDFSTELVTSTTRALTCPSNIPWADCVDSICTLDPHDPTKAKCQCQVVKKGPAFTFGGNCDVRTCSTTIWSGSSPSLGAETGSPAVKAAMKRLGQPVVLPPPCPKT